MSAGEIAPVFSDNAQGAKEEEMSIRGKTLGRTVCFVVLVACIAIPAIAGGARGGDVTESEPVGHGGVGNPSAAGGTVAAGTTGGDAN